MMMIIEISAYFKLLQTCMFAICRSQRRAVKNIYQDNISFDESYEIELEILIIYLHIKM